MHLKFWIKTLFYRFYPFPIGSLHNYRKPDYDYVRDTHPVRKKHYGKEGWQNKMQGDLQYRDYTNYQEYIDHQVQKFNEILQIKYFSNRTISAFRRKFYKRFRHLSKYLQKNAQILCAGARQGTEVEVLHDLGFKKAYGIDLNPGPNNKYVIYGDFLHLKNPDSSLDLIFCNAIDHSYDLEAFFAEHARAIKPSGFVLYEIPYNVGGVFESVKWASTTSIILLMLKYFRSIIKVETEHKVKWLLLQGKQPKNK